MTAKRPLLTDMTRMEQGVTDLSQLSQVISHATAPAFLLGAVAGFVSILITRMNGIIDRIRSLNSIADDNTTRARLKSDIPRLEDLGAGGVDAAGGDWIGSMIDMGWWPPREGTSVK